MESSGSLFVAALVGMFLLLFILALGVIIARALAQKPTSSPPIIRSDDGHFDVAGKRVVCSHCSGVLFASQDILLNTWLLSLLRIDWLDSSATVLTCRKCGKLTWFAQESPETD